MIKIFYTNREGRQIFEKSISKWKFNNLLKDLASVDIPGWRSEVFLIKFVKLFGIKIFGKKLFQTEVHSIFIPVKNTDRYHRWDSVNGWNTMSDDNIKTLTKQVLANANSKQNKNRRKSR